jgi:hypothetical protein
MLLGAINYDPAAAVSKATSSLLAMTALDTTNLRITFTAPANGIVLVRLRCTITGATTMPTILLGILEGSTVKARISPLGAVSGTAVASTQITQEALFTVSGLTPGNSYTWDAAYGVEIVLASTNIKYGGPDNNSGNNAWGGFQFEIYDAPNCLGSKLYDPSSAVSKATTSLLAMTAIDTTNLRITFTAPASGKVLVRMRAPVHGATTFPQILFGVLDGSTVRARTAPLGGLKTTAVATAQLAREGQCVVTGLTGGTSYTWDAAYAVQVLIASTGLKYGGPDNATTNDAWGGFLYEIWAL